MRLHARWALIAALFPGAQWPSAQRTTGSVNASPVNASPAEVVRPYLVALSVKSIERSANWYCRHLRFCIVGGIRRPRPGVATALLQAKGFYIELAELSGSRARTSALPIPGSNGSLQGLYKLGFWVWDVDSTISRLERAGVSEYRGPVATDMLMNVRYALIKDPDGNVIQLFSSLRPHQ